MIQKQVGLRIREIRQSKHLSQEDFSFEVGLDRTYISSVERGLRNISIINLDKISHSFGMSLKEFFDPVVRRKMDLHNWDSGINRDFGGHIGIRYL